MHDLHILTSELSIEVPLRPLAFSPPQLAELSDTALEAFGKYGLVAENIHLSLDDALFRYSVRFQLFRELINVTLTATSLTLEFKSAVNSADLDVVAEIATHSIRTVDARFHSPIQAIIRWNAHARFSTSGASQDFFASLAPEGWTLGGKQAYYLPSNETAGETINISADNSFPHENAAFLSEVILNADLAALANSTKLAEKLTANFRVFDLDPRFSDNSIPQ